MIFGIEVGSWADIVSSVTALASTVLAILALRIAKAANETAERVRKEAKEQADLQTKRDEQRDERAEAMQASVEARERERDRREDERDRRRIAEGVAAWWVNYETTGKWGILISNPPANPTVFYSITIETAGNDVKKSIRMKTLPPGVFFVESTNVGWDYPRLVDEIAGYAPIVNSPNHFVRSMKFTDQLGTKWKWEKDIGVSQDLKSE